jgi:hypothetical protein
MWAPEGIENDTKYYFSTFSDYANVLFKIIPMTQKVYPIIRSDHDKD